jgi:hypothetical protein
MAGESSIFSLQHRWRCGVWKSYGSWRNEKLAASAQPLNSISIGESESHQLANGGSALSTQLSSSAGAAAKWRNNSRVKRSSKISCCEIAMASRRHGETLGVA